ncbi:protein-disulfide reductase DsbD domain-containing protein [Pedobacter sp. AW1-32]|uniref:protein-disulfide reductase DsbD domain-containing protein n=1 Tax=Pedobacter sp. AW1-32 TaxID=3383026 RepID=UPI003FEE82B7
MRKLLFIFAAMLFNIAAHAQIEKPVTWSYGAKKINTTEAIVYLKANIEDGWHIYSQDVKDGGPVKTSFTFARNPAYVPLGKTIEPKPITKFEKTFKMDVSYFEKTVVFQQKVKIKPGSVVVKGTVEFMVCNDKQCLPPEEVSFSIPIK